jgi:hypothetical protein
MGGLMEHAVSEVIIHLVEEEDRDNDDNKHDYDANVGGNDTE